MIVRLVRYGRHHHRERHLFVCFQDVQKVVVLENTHGAFGQLQVVSTDRSDDSFEETWDQMADLLDFAQFKHFLKLSQEEFFFDAVSKGPILEEAFKERDGQGAVLCEELE